MASASAVSIRHAQAPAGPQRFVDPYLWVVMAAGALVVAAALYAIARELPMYAQLGWQRWALLAGLVASSWWVLTHLILFDWRGQRVALGPDEVLVFLALVALPSPLVVLFAVGPMAAYQVRTRRPFMRGGANVAVVALASAAGVTTHIALSMALAPFLATIAAIVAYTFTTHLLVSSVFALREDTPVHVVFGERFWIPTLLHVTLGVTGGVAIVALYALHPAALAALVPFGWLAKEHVTLVARRERETLVHTRLADLSKALVGERDLDRVSDGILTACGDLFQAGHVSLVVSEEGKERRWERDFEGGYKPAAHALAATLRGADGAVLGALMVHPNRRMNQGYGETDVKLLTIVAGNVSSCIANARALRDLEAARARIEQQRVSKPLVRRIVRDLMTETRADSLVLMRLGEQLAAGVESAGVEPALRAYAEMGLGHLKVVASEKERFEFVGENLMERADGSRMTTCYLALGFLRGAASRANGGAAAAGAEVECCSRGDARCRFVVNVK